jgi:RNA polymerase sigma-70 factor (ECF subfamily)
MYGRVDRLAGAFVDRKAMLEREFELRLAESSTLAVRVAFAVVRRREDAEDVAQEAFARAYRRFDQLRDRDRFRAWLVRMTWRLAIDRRRADRRRLARDGAYLQRPAPAAADDAIAARERAERLWRAVDSLPEKLRVVVVLANIQEHDLGEVARLLGLPTGTVKSRLFLARQRLRELL